MSLTLREHLTLAVDEAVFRLIEKVAKLPREQLLPSARLFHDLKLSGDDADELLVAFAEEFRVDLSGFEFLKYFPDEGQSSFIDQVFSWESDRKSKLPLTIADLVVAVTTGTLQPAAAL